MAERPPELSSLPLVRRSDVADGLPTDWNYGLLGDVASISLGRTPARKRKEFWFPPEVPWVSISDLTSGRISRTREQISRRAHEDIFGGRLVPAGTLLLSFKLTIGRTGVLDIPAVHNEAIANLSIEEARVDRDFLGYQLSTLDYSPYLDDYVKGKTLNKGKLERLRLVLPPISEQRAIASVLRTVQKAKEATEKVIEGAREVKRSFMRHLFMYGPVPLEDVEGVHLQDFEAGQSPKEWPIRRVEELAEEVTVGIVVRPASHYVREGVPAFRSLNIREDRLETRNLMFIDREAHKTKLAKSALRTGDVLVVRTGYPGTSCVVPPEFDDSNCIDLVIVRPTQDQILSEYLSRYFNSEAAKHQFLAAKVGLAQQHLNVGALKRALVPLPPIEVQEFIVQILHTIDAKLLAEEGRRAALKTMFLGALSDLMTGRRRVTDVEVADG
jgi:type I restriction enzyme S subunit